MGERLEAKGISLIPEPEAVSWLAERGFDPERGARPLRRAVQTQVEDQAACMLITGELKSGDNLRLRVGEDRLIALREPAK